MAQVVIRKIDDDAMARLKARARRKGVSLCRPAERGHRDDAAFRQLAPVSSNALDFTERTRRQIAFAAIRATDYWNGFDQEGGLALSEAPGHSSDPRPLSPAHVARDRH